MIILHYHAFSIYEITKRFKHWGSRCRLYQNHAWWRLWTTAVRCRRRSVPPEWRGTWATMSDPSVRSWSRGRAPAAATALAWCTSRCSLRRRPHDTWWCSQVRRPSGYQELATWSGRRQSVEGDWQRTMSRALEDLTQQFSTHTIYLLWKSSKYAQHRSMSTNTVNKQFQVSSSKFRQNEEPSRIHL